MAKYEIERKFLLNNVEWEEWRHLATGSISIKQGYLSRRKEATVRVRICNEKAWLTVKGITTGDTREEYEYNIPVEDAERMLMMCEGRIVEKIRYFVPLKNLVYEVDIFEGSLAGLQICEVEIPQSGMELQLPPFVGKEVTGDPRYYNSNL